MKAAEEFFHLLDSVPLAALPLRSPPLEAIQDTIVIDELAEEQQVLIREKMRFSLRFQIEEARASQPFDVAADVISRKSIIFGIFDTEWRAANSFYKKICLRSPLLRSAKKRAADLKLLHTFISKQKSFEVNPKYTGLLGRAFEGLQTPVEYYQALVNWYGKVRDWSGRWFRYEPAVTRAVMRMEPETVNRFQVLGAEDLRKSLKQATWHLNQMKEAATGLLADDWFGDFHEAYEKAKSLSDNLDASLPDIHASLCSEEILPSEAAFRVKPYLKIAFNRRFQTSRSDMAIVKRHAL